VTQPIVSVRPWTVFSDVARLVHLCLEDLGGISQFVKPGQSVLIKPNLTADAPPCTGGTTHVEIVDALIDELKTCNPSRIIVGEATGRFGTSVETAFPNFGWREIAARQGVELANLDGGPHQEITLPNPHYPRPLPFSQLTLDVDVFITVPLLKTHINADYTVSLKNSYALTPQWKRSEIHGEYLLEEALADLNRIRKPDLTLVDGWDGSEGTAGGAKFERPAAARLMLASGDPVAVDVVSREIMGFSASTRYLHWAIEAGLGEGSLDKIEVRGMALEQAYHRFMTSGEELELLQPGLFFCDQTACSGCRAIAQTAIQRFAAQKLLRPLNIVYGKEGDPALFAGAADPGAATLLVGNCASRYVGQPDMAGAEHVPGCAPKGGDIVAALERLGVYCTKCKALAEELLSELPADILPYLRIAAAGTQVYAGDKVQRDQWHLELLVGECMGRYARVVMERASQFGLDAERDVVWLTQCPPSREQVLAAVERLRAAVPEGIRA
jgi:uncharacterized protein (DUF362 family)